MKVHKILIICFLGIVIIAILINFKRDKGEQRCRFELTLIQYYGINSLSSNIYADSIDNVSKTEANIWIGGRKVALKSDAIVVDHECE